MKSKVEHTIIRNQKLFCQNCGGEQIVPYPIVIPMFGAMVTAFNKMHKNCPKTWKEPEADLSQSIEQRANWWLTYGEHGLSSMAMFRTFHDSPAQINHPSDPDDFRRCYLLLKAIPEWKAELSKVAKLSIPWHNLVMKWDELTKMLEEQFQTHKPNGMYELMQKCIENKI